MVWISALTKMPTRLTALITAFGYDESAELTSDSDRRKFGLAPRGLSNIFSICAIGAFHLASHSPAFVVVDRLYVRPVSRSSSFT